MSLPKTTPRGGPSLRGLAALLALAALTGLAALLAGCGASTLPPIHSETERLAQARAAVEKKQWSVAIELLKSYVANNAGGAEVDQAIELLGESYLKVNEWAQAQNEFERLLRDYPESDSSGAAACRLGDALWGQARSPDFDQEYTEKALAQWQSYLRAYPGHWLNPQAEKSVLQARSRLAKKYTDTGMLYVKLKRPGPARIYFERVIEEFPDTPSEPAARLGLARADLRAAKYDLALAEFKDVEARYPGKSVASQAAKERAALERRLHLDTQGKK